MIKGIDHINIAVKDVDRVITLFQKMGFQLIRRRTEGDLKGMAELKLPDDSVIYEISPVNPNFFDGKSGVRHIAFAVDDAQKTFDELKAKGIKSREDKPTFYPEIGGSLFNCVDDDLDSFRVQFQDKKRKPSVSR